MKFSNSGISAILQKELEKKNNNIEILMEPMIWEARWPHGY